MWIVDSASLIFLAVNDAALQNWECTREELIGRRVGDLAARENQRLPRGLREEFVRASLARSEDNVPWRHRPKGGAWIDVKGACHRITFNGKGAVLIVVEDAPAQAAAVAGGSERADSFDLAAEAIIIRDLQHRVLFWSGGAERLYGWSAAEAIGADARHLFKDDHAHFARASSALLVHDSWNASVEQRRKDGGIVIVKSRWSLIRDPNGRPVSILIVDTDSAEVKKLRWQFLRAQRLHAIGTLAGGIAHDLNNILSPILMSVGLIRRISDDAGAQRMINIIEASAERGAGIV
jgi:PAS domain S-box-containing protein